MKTLKLICGLFLHILLYISYKVYKSNIIELKDFYLPRLYSSTNKNIITVSISNQNSVIIESNITETILLSNELFFYKPKIFDIEDTDELYEYNLKCKPKSFGYSKKEARRMFPNIDYYDCSDITGIKESLLHIDREKNQIYMTCINNSGNFLYGPYSRYNLVDFTDTLPQENHNNGPVNYSNVEFGLGECNADPRHFMHAALEPVFNEKAYNNAKKKKKPGKPIIIYFLTIDSFSRRHFFRKLPNTIKFVNYLNKHHPDFAIYDFKLHNVFGHTSVENQVPILGKLENFVSEFEGDQYIDKLGKDALWNILREEGYISLLGFDDCDHYFSQSLGKNPNVDYSVRQFYCYVKKKTMIDTEHTGRMQRCIGPYMNHYYILNYTHTVAKLNQGANQWFYIHLNAAHEQTGQHAGTLDNDLKYFIDLFLKEYNEDNDIVILLQGDHGNSFARFIKEINGDMEFKLPSFFLIASKELLKRFPFSYHALHENTYRLIIKSDLRKTMLEIAGITEKSHNSISLLSEIALKSRDCENLSMYPEYCSCNEFEEIVVYTASQEVLFNHLKVYAEHEINSLSYSHKDHFLQRICKKITLDKITSVFHFQLNNVNELYRIAIRSATRKNMEFQIYFFLASDQRNMELNRDNHRKINLIFESYPIQARVRCI